MTNDAFENALKQRLAKLSTLPVEDMVGIESGVQEEIQGGAHRSVTLGIARGMTGCAGGGVEQGTTGRPPARMGGDRGTGGGKEGDPGGYKLVPGFHFTRMWRMAVGIAASIVLVAIVGLALLQSRPAEASLMVQLHRDIVAGKIATMKVDSIAEVNEAFAAFGQHGIRMEAPDMHVMSCCLRNVGNKQVYCVLLNEGNVPVTLTIADLSAVSPAEGSVVMRGGAAYDVTTVADLTMVTTDRGGHRVCLIGAVPAEKLMGLAEGLKF